MRLSLVRISFPPGFSGGQASMQDPELQPSQSPAVHTHGWFSALLQLSRMWKPVQRLPVPLTGPKVRTEPEGLLDEKLVCTVKILTPPMKGANGLGIGLGENYVRLVGLRARPRAVALLGTDAP